MRRRSTPPGETARLLRACLSGAAAGLVGGLVLVGGVLLFAPGPWHNLVVQCGLADLALALARIPLAFAMIGLALGPVTALDAAD